MKGLIPIFRFTLGPSQSIGPTQLHALWSQACQSPHTSVGRTASGGRPLYSLYASQQLQDLALVERRLRWLLDQRHLNASLVHLHAA